MYKQIVISVLLLVVTPVFGQEKLDALIQSVEEGTYRDVFDAVESIRDMGPAAAEAIPVLRALQEEQSFEELNQLISMTLKRIDPQAESRVDELVNTLKQNSTMEARLRAMQDLAATGTDNPEAVEVMVNIAKNETNPMLKQNAIRMLAMMGAGFEEVMPSLLETLYEAEDPKARSQAALGIGMFGKQAQSVIPDLLEVIEEGHPTVRTFSLVALGQIRSNPDEVLPVFYDALKNDELKQAALLTISNFETRLETVEKVMDLLEDPHPKIRASAARALGHMGIAAEKALQELEDLAEESNLDVKNEAERAIRKIEFRND